MANEEHLALLKQGVDAWNTSDWLHPPVLAACLIAGALLLGVALDHEAGTRNARQHQLEAHSDSRVRVHRTVTGVTNVTRNRPIVCN